MSAREGLLAGCLLASAAPALAAGLPPLFSDGPQRLVRVDAAPEVAPARAAALEAACLQVTSTLGPLEAPLVLQVRQAPSVEAFVASTGRARFEAAALVQGVVWLQPEGVLARLADVDGVLRHECVHAWLRAHGLRLPRLLEEALAVGASGQAARLPPAPPLTVAELEAVARELARPTGRAGYERAVARAAATFWPPLQGLEAGARAVLLRRIQAAPEAAWLDVPLSDGGGGLRGALAP